MLIEYGKYSEQDYINALNEAKFGIWLGCTESQGIGLQEALATDLPLIVLDATSLFENAIKPKKSRFKNKIQKNLFGPLVEYFNNTICVLCNFSCMGHSFK